MPFAKNWVEELILEWLLLKGYLALSNIRLKSGKSGGVKEADILGLKLVKGSKELDRGKGVEVLEIIHIETGCLAGNFKENLQTIRQKFAQERVETIKEISLDIIERESVLGQIFARYSRRVVSVKYRPIYIASYVAKKQINKLKKELKKDSIEFLTLEEVLKNIVLDIDEWKRKQIEKGFRVTKQITLPESWWLLNLIDYMKSKGLVKRELLGKEVRRQVRNANRPGGMLQSFNPLVAYPMAMVLKNWRSRFSVRYSIASGGAPISYFRYLRTSFGGTFLTLSRSFTAIPHSPSLSFSMNSSELYTLIFFSLLPRNTAIKLLMSTLTSYLCRPVNGISKGSTKTVRCKNCGEARSRSCG